MKELDYLTVFLDEDIVQNLPKYCTLFRRQTVKALKNLFGCDGYMDELIVIANIERLQYVKYQKTQKGTL